MKLNAMSYNTLHCCDWKRGVIDYDKIAGVVRGADIVGLNEMRGLGPRDDYEAQAEILAGKLGVHAYFAMAIRLHGGNPYGNALLSRFPILSARSVLIPDPPAESCDQYRETRCVLDATLDAGRPLRVLVTHFGLNASEQKNAVDTILSLLDDTPTILMGDLNVTPDNPLLAPLRARMTDSAAGHCDGALSFPSDEPRVKIDYLFVRGLTVCEAEIPAVVVSDHRPYRAVLELAE